MTHYWSLQDAKAKLSELVKKVRDQGPQYITVHGNPSVVVISQEEYKNLITPKISLIDFFRKSPLMGLKLDLSRDKSPNREIDL
jgi:antitoxin Phd